MKKISTLIALAMMGSIGFAQSFTAADMPQIGDSQYYTAADTTGVTEGASGTGAVWDYSTLTPSGSNFTITYGAPAGHPQASNYPAANFLESASNQQYRFMSTSTDSTVLEGEKSTANTAIIYDRKATLYIFPMSFGYLQIDSVHGTYPDGFFSSVDRLGQYYIEVDAAGSLTTPYATYPNVLRLRTIGTFFDSSYTGAADATVATMRHEWYSVGTTTPVMIMTYTSIAINGGSPQIGRDVWYADIPNSIGHGSANFQLTVAPSVVDDQTEVSYTLSSVSDVKISVSNILGEVMVERSSAAEGAGVHAHTLDMSTLSPGVYMVRLETGNGQQIKKIVVQ